MADEDILWDFPLTESLEGRILEATLNRCKALNLPCIPKDNHIIKPVAWLGDLSVASLPCLVITPPPETTNWRDGSNERDIVTFGVFISVILANERQATLRGMGLQLFWRQKIRRAFQSLASSRFTQLRVDPTTTETFRMVYVENGDRFIESAKRMQIDAQFLLLRMECSEPREPRT